MSTFDTENWFALYVAWCVALISSNGLAVGIFALVVGTIGYFYCLRFVNELFLPAACHAAANSRKELCAVPCAIRK